LVSDYLNNLSLYSWMNYWIQNYWLEVMIYVNNRRTTAVKWKADNKDVSLMLPCLLVRGMELYSISDGYSEFISKRVREYILMKRGIIHSRKYLGITWGIEVQKIYALLSLTKKHDYEELDDKKVIIDSVIN